MTPLNQLKAVEYALESTAPVSVSQPASGMRSLFLGPRGLRAGWRLVTFIGLLVVLFGGTTLVLHGGPQGLRNAPKHMDQVTVTPFMLCYSDFCFAFSCGAAEISGVPWAFMWPTTGDNHCSEFLIAVSRLSTIFSIPRLAGRSGSRAGFVGPEARVLTPIALALVALVFSRYYRGNPMQ